MPPPIPDDRSKQDSHRAKVRMGIAAALLIIAIALLAVLNQRRTDKAAEGQETPQAQPTSLSSSSMETAPAALPEESPVALSPETLPATEPPPPPEPGKLSESAAISVQKTPSVPAIEEESTGISDKPFVASATQALSKPVMSAAAVQSPARMQSQPAPMTPSSSAPLTAKSFDVQLGVFTDIENAKQLQAKLANHGIPSHTETRVQIGPFKSREEADRAREKLNKLGISAVVRGN